MKYRIYVDTTKKRRDGQCPVVLIFEDMGSRFKVATGLFSSVKFTGREFPESEPNHRVKTMALCRKMLKIDEFLIENDHVSLSRVREAVRGIISGRKSNEKTLADYLQGIADKCSESTAKFYRLTAKKILAFDEKANFATVDAEWLERFDRWLQDNGCKTTNGRGVHLRNMRRAFNQAIEDRVTDRYPFRKFRVRMARVAINNITVEQLRELRDCDVEPHKRIYRDLFMLSFYLCGINPVDMLHLTKDNVRNGRIVYTRRKTHKLYDIPLPDEAKVIIDRYHGEKYLLSIMDCEYDYLKFVSKWDRNMKLLGHMGVYPDALGRRKRKMGKPILPHITVYSARYTFASIGAQLEIPRETIALCLGHSWADVTAHYISYDIKRIDDAVRRIIDFVNGDKKK